MNKNLFIIILLAVIGAGIYFSMNDSDKLRKIHQKKIDSIQKINEDLINQREDLKEIVIVKDIQQEELEKLADSLAQEAQKPIPCTHKVIIQEKEIGALRGALTKCKETKEIQRVTIGLCDSLLINHKIIVVNHEEMHKISKKEKKKSFFKGAGVGGAVGILLVLLILL